MALDMIATSAKLRDCTRDAMLPCQHPLSSGGNCWDCLTCFAREAVREISLPLARLVLELEAALRDVETFIKPKHYRPIEVIRKALAALEKLEL